MSKNFMRATIGTVDEPTYLTKALDIGDPILNCKATVLSLFSKIFCTHTMDTGH